MAIYLNQQPVSRFVFGGGECQVRIAAERVDQQVQLTALLHSANDVMDLLLTVDALRRVNPACRIVLQLPYVPYGRQDRVCNPGEALSIQVMAGLINGLQCEQVEILDPHSEVTTALLQRCRVRTMAELVADSELVNWIVDQQLALLAPDAGAEKKVAALAARLQRMGVNCEWFAARKQRNSLSGAIDQVEVPDEVAGKRLLVVDDICDGGRTFTALARVLQAKGAADSYLYVTHGIFSQGLQVLQQGFKRVFCYHTFLSAEQCDSSFLTVLGQADFC